MALQALDAVHVGVDNVNVVGMRRRCRWVCEVDRIGNDREDEAAYFGRRRASLAVVMLGVTCVEFASCGILWFRSHMGFPLLFSHAVGGS